MIAAIVIAAVVVVVLAAIAVHRRARLPTRSAAKRLAAQLVALRAEERRLGVVDRGFVRAQEQTVRAKWLAERLAGTPIEDVDVHGIGPAAYRALRAAGIDTLAALPRLARMKVDGIGDKRAAQLAQAYREARERTFAEAERLDRAALDAISDGRLGRVLARHDAEELDRLRALEAVRIRVAELERRYQQIRT